MSCVKSFDHDRLRNDRALGTGKSDNNKNPKNYSKNNKKKNNVRGHLAPVSGSRISRI